MRKRIMKLSVLPALLALTFLSFSKKSEDVEIEKNPQKEEVEKVVIDSLESEDLKVEKLSKIQITVDTNKISLPLLQKDYLGFKTAIGFKESQGNYYSVNKFGYMGKYQFGKNTLAMIGVHNTAEFMKNPQLQEDAFYAYISRNKWVLRKYIDQFSGEKIGGVDITESGIIAAAHLAGPGGVKRFLRSGGSLASSDAFGTDIKHYLEMFGGYDISFIPANQQANIEQLAAKQNS